MAKAPQLRFIETMDWILLVEGIQKLIDDGSLQDIKACVKPVPSGMTGGPEGGSTMSRLNIGTPWGAILACVLACFSAAAPALAHSDRSGMALVETEEGTQLRVVPPAQVAYRQLDQDDRIASFYHPNARISFSLVTVPDPRVPRHRRAYDLSIVALMQGMQDQGYSLDRYIFPWQQQPEKKGEEEGDGKKKDKDKDEGDDKNESDKGPDTRSTDDGRYGLMVFRRDDWRQSTGIHSTAEVPPRLQVMYVLPETATYGLPPMTACRAVMRILTQTGEEKEKRANLPCAVKADVAGNPLAMSDPWTRLSSHPICDGDSRKPYVLLLGPNFSGSMNSLAELNRELTSHGLPRVCAASASATAASNPAIRGYAGPAGTPLEFHTIAVSDEDKIAWLWDFSKLAGINEPNRIVILSETSTFGGEICPVSDTPQQGMPSGDACSSPELGNAQKRKCFCRFAYRISYPSNIADVRAALQQPLADNEALLEKMALGQYLPLDHGAGNGSEYPVSQQSTLTASGTYIQLQRTMKLLKNISPSPRLVVVVGTDVRDRLFMFDQLREGLPSAQLVDLEADLLMNHPQYIHASRGALLMASERLAWYMGRGDGGYNMEVSASDVQVLQRSLVRGIDENAEWRRKSKTPLPACSTMPVDGPIAHVVVRKSVVPLLCLDKKGKDLWLIYVPTLAAASFLLLFLAAPISRRMGLDARRGRPMARASEYLQKKFDGYDPAINRSLILVILALLLMLSFSALVSNLVLVSIALVVAPLYCWAISYLTGAHDAIQMPSGAKAPGPIVTSFLSDHALGVAALLLSAAMAGLWLSANEFDGLLLARIGYSAGAGMALPIALILTALVLLLGDSALAVARLASQRNAAVVEEAFAIVPRSAAAGELRRAFTVNLFPRSTLMIVGMLFLLLCTLAAYPTKVTVYGHAASLLATVAVAAMNYVALLFLVNAIRMRQRALWVVSLIRLRVSAAGNGNQGDGVIGLWPASQASDIRFASTPAMARVKGGGSLAIWMLGARSQQWFARALGRLLHVPSPLDGESGPQCRRARIALHTLLASEVSQIRWATFCGLAMCLAIAGFVYMYPVSGANAFILFNLAILTLMGLFAGHTAMSLERNEVMSNVLCNRTVKVEWSGTLFNYVAVPFVVLAVVIAITQIPGVINLGGGFFDSTLKELASTIFGGL